MLALGLLIGSGAIRSRLLAFKDMPGKTSDEWMLAVSLAEDAEACDAFVTEKVADPYVGQPDAAPEARVMRAFVRNEMLRRLRMAALMHARFCEFSPVNAKEQAEVCDRLREFCYPQEDKETPNQGG